MYIIVHDNNTELDARTKGGPPSVGGPDVSARPGRASSSSVLANSFFFGVALENGFREGRIPGVEGQETLRRETTVECPAEEAAGKDSPRWACKGGVFQRPVDLSARRPGDRTGIWGPLSSRPCVVSVEEPWLDLPDARTASSGRRQGRGTALAHDGVATNKKGARRKLAVIAFLDESGFMLHPLRHRTWSPRGRTPVHKAWDRRDRLSAIGALTVSPHRRHLNLYFHIQSRNVEGEDMVYFVEQLHRHVCGPLVVVWDRSGPHKAAGSQLLRKHSDWLSVELLPSYSPELNPQEHCWDQTKYHDLANFLPENVNELYNAASNSLAQQHRNQSLLHSHFQYAQLPL